jgi:hypothetical protein
MNFGERGREPLILRRRSERNSRPPLAGMGAAEALARTAPADAWDRPPDPPGFSPIRVEWKRAGSALAGDPEAEHAAKRAQLRHRLRSEMISRSN